MVSEIYGLHEFDRPGHVSATAPDSVISHFKLSCKIYIDINHRQNRFETNPMSGSKS